MNRLILFRHGKAEADSESGEDFDRRLAPSGVAESAAVAALFSSFLAQAVTAITNASNDRVRRPLVNIVCLPPDWMRSHVGSMTLEPRPRYRTR